MCMYVTPPGRVDGSTETIVKQSLHCSTLLDFSNCTRTGISKLISRCAYRSAFQMPNADARTKFGVVGQTGKRRKRLSVRSLKSSNVELGRENARHSPYISQFPSLAWCFSQPQKLSSANYVLYVLLPSRMNQGLSGIRALTSRNLLPKNVSRLSPLYIGREDRSSISCIASQFSSFVLYL